MRQLRRVGLVAVVAGVSVHVISCGDDDSGGGNDTLDASTGGTSGSGGGPAGSGGVSGGGGATGGGGQTGGTGGGVFMFDGGSGDTVQICAGQNPINPSLLNLQPCPLCEDAYCVPESLLSSLGDAAATSSLLADCPTGGKCVPASYVASAGRFLLKTCTAFGAAEGRCVNKCIPQVANQVGLEQDVCGANELCAPCYMPTDGSPSGACGLGCDPGPTQDPYLFEPCCGSDGVCVPQSLVPEEQRFALTQDTCTDSNALCAPSAFVSPDYIPPTCTSIGGAEGRCIPSCVGALAGGLSEYLPQDTCVTGSVCAPCYDPRPAADGGMPSQTGACNLNGDAPTEDPVVFGSCCGDQGVCVPGPLPTQFADFATYLAKDPCGDSGDVYCVPEEPVSGGWFATCDFEPVPGGSNPPGPGVCINACAIPATGIFRQLNCDVGYRCVPCFDAQGQPIFPGLCGDLQPPDAGTPTDGGTDASLP